MTGAHSHIKPYQVRIKAYRQSRYGQVWRPYRRIIDTDDTPYGFDLSRVVSKSTSGEN